VAFKLPLIEEKESEEALTTDFRDAQRSVFWAIPLLVPASSKRLKNINLRKLIFIPFVY
jgi:hypothetical protein